MLGDSRARRTAADARERVDAFLERLVAGRFGYRFGDDWKLGLPLLVQFGAVAVLLVPAIWSV